MIRIVGLGPGSNEDLTLKAINTMKNASKLFFRTEKHPNVEYLKTIGLKFETFDLFYEKEESFDSVYEKIANKIMEFDDVVYAVPGHPLVAEKSVQLIISLAEKLNKKVEIISAVSFIDAVLNSIKVDPVAGLKIIDGLQLDIQRPDTEVANIVTQIYNRFTASEIKIKLMEVYDDETEVILIRAAGVEGQEKIEKMPLYNIDRVEWVDYLTSLYIPPIYKKDRYNFNDLVNIMARLRGDDGCPWDREQTHESLKRYLLEESYEVIDAINNDNMDGLCEELGDVLLQVVFHSQIGNEFGEFDIADVVHGITDKMIKRHTHVFGEDKCETSGEVLDNWEKIKREEKKISSHTESLISIPKVLPALIRSYKIQEKASGVGFDWDNIDDVVLKIHEELKEFLDVYKTDKNDKIVEELGDLLFAVVNVARFLDINPEFALTNTSEKFIKRFGYIEKIAREQGKNLEQMTLKEMDILWNQAKYL